ncbi:hypothetical protein GpartN1_g3458.t1 [Galdieria partita]|uniref:Guided entry of tail-anchored proteins factor 1 n=1 Tax=Galdieria partita TaxID=83374 RepID=A0A9C7PY70_9RHOD|nr:hypothetical protein GpartN1_g3458.t1 [Galdieria partita]
MDWYSLYIICFQFLYAFLHHQIINKETPPQKEKDLAQQFRHLRTQVEKLNSPSTFVEYSKAKRRCLDLERQLELSQVARIRQLEVYKMWKTRVGWFYRISVFLLSFLLSRWWSRSIYLFCDWVWPLNVSLFRHKTGVCAIPSWIWGTVCERGTFILFCYVFDILRQHIYQRTDLDKVE